MQLRPSLEYAESVVTLMRQETGFGFRIVGGTEEGSQVGAMVSLPLRFFLCFYTYTDESNLYSHYEDFVSTGWKMNWIFETGRTSLKLKVFITQTQRLLL